MQPTELVANPLGSTKVSDEDYNLTIGEYLSRPTFIASGTWLITDPIGTVELNTSIFQALMASTRVANKLDGFRYIKGKLHVRISLNGSPYHSGRLHASWLHRGGGNNQQTALTKCQIIAPVQYTAMYGKCLDPTSQEAYELELPYVAQAMTDMTDSAYDGLAVRVLNPLRWSGAATATTSVGWVVYAWMTDVEVFVPLWQSELAGGMAAAIVNSATRVVKGYASSYARRAADGILTSMGLGTPVTSNVNTYVKSDYIVHMRSDGGRIATYLDGHQIIEDKLGEAPAIIDEMSFESIYKRESVIKIGSIPANTISGNVDHVHDSPCHITDSTSPYGLTARQFTTTPGGYIAQAFKYWRGTSVYRLEVVCNKFARGVLRMVYLPNYYSGAMPTFSFDMADAITVELDLALGNTVELRVPWSQRPPWLSTTAGVAGDLKDAQTRCNGAIILQILNPISGSAVVDYNIWYKGEHLEFADLNTFFLDAMVPFTNDGSIGYLQALTKDNYVSVRDVIKKPCLKYQITGTDWVAPANKFRYFNFPSFFFPVPLTTDAGSPQLGGFRVLNTLFDHFAMMYLCYTGGFRHTIVSTQNAGDGYTARIIRRNEVAPSATSLTGADVTLDWKLLSSDTRAYFRSSDTQGYNDTVVAHFPFPANFVIPRAARGVTLSTSYPQYECLELYTRDKHDLGVLQSADDDATLSVWQFVPLLYMLEV